MDRKEELEIIKKITERAEKSNLLMFDKLSLMMDLDCINQLIGLDFQKLLNANNFNFRHDIVGIQNNINRQKIKLENLFVPRCSS